MAAVIDRDDIDIDFYLNQTDAPHKVKPARAYAEKVREWLANGGRQIGACAPWQKTYDHLRFRPGEVTLWAGYSGARKSMILGQVILGFIDMGHRAVIASMEMQPHVTLGRMKRQASMGPAPTDAFLNMFDGWSDGKLWVYDHLGMVRTEEILAVSRYCADQKQIGANHMVIDSLMKCVRGEDDYNGQKLLIDALCAIGRETGMHIHLVHHMKKGESEDKPGNKFDLKGTGAITDQADNVIVVWRNKPKERALKDPKKAGEVDLTRGDLYLVVEKQRNGEFEGPISLWFDEGSLQYVDNMDGRPMTVIH